MELILSTFEIVCQLLLPAASEEGYGHRVPRGKIQLLARDESPDEAPPEVVRHTAEIVVLKESRGRTRFMPPRKVGRRYIVVRGGLVIVRD